MALDKDWEKFSGGPNKPNRERIHITMNSTGLIYLNKNAHRMMGAPEAVQFFFNRKIDKIALKPANPILSDAFPVQAKGNYYLIHANPICRNFGIRLTTTEKFLDPNVDSSGNLILDLARTLTVRKRK